MTKYIELIENNQWEIFILFSLFAIIPLIPKHVKEWLDLTNYKRNNHLDTLKKLSEDIDNDLYSTLYNSEKKDIFFTYLCNKKIFSEKKREVLLNLLKLEIITKKDIKKYSYHFHICQDKIHIPITFGDKVEIYYLRMVSLFFIIFSIFIVLNLPTKMTIVSALIIILILVLLLIAILAIVESFKIRTLEGFIKKLEAEELYTSEAC